MTVNPGYMGQLWFLRQLEKLRFKKNDYGFRIGYKISVDGNVNSDTIPSWSLWCRYFSLGSSSLFRKDLIIPEAIEKIHASIDLEKLNKGKDMSYRLGINTGFALNRFSEPEEWTRILVRNSELNIFSLQLTC